MFQGKRQIRQINLVETLYSSGISYPVPSNLTYSWNFGVYALVVLVSQIITGILLCMHYVGDQSLAFLSVEHIMRDIQYGWEIRYLHANGASMFFIVVYIHTFRGLYYGSYVYPRQHLWSIGVIILLVMILCAFMGYVLPWGQMSFWGATVITNLCSVVPSIGPAIVVWLWGGFSVGGPTLNRFFSLHYLFAFVILGLVIVHLIFLHDYKSNNPLGFKSKVDGIFFYPYYIYKDLYGIMLFLMFFGVFLFFFPDMLGHPDNYIEANPMVTPTHIVPEWYFLPFYAILRAIPDKLGGVLALLGSILSLLTLPYLSIPEVRSLTFRPLARAAFFMFVIVALVLGWMGGKPIEYPYTWISQLASVLYFSYFLWMIPAIVYLEKLFWTNTDYVLKKKESWFHVYETKGF